MEITSHYFFNLALLTIILFISLVWIDRNVRLNYSKAAAFFCLTIMIWICFLFSYQPEPGFLFDLRIIPVILGGLYVGVGPHLAVVIVLLRMFYGVDAGFIFTSIEFLILGVLFCYLHKKFLKVSPKKRICFSVVLTTGISLITIILLEFSPLALNQFDLWLAMLLIPPLGVGMAAYIIEFVIKTIDMQSKLIKTEKLEAVEQMGAAISHEIRNPLTAAIGFVQLLKEQTLPPQKRAEYLSIVQTELESAERVIQNYLTFSKPALERIEDINVKRELSHVISILKPIANQNSVEIITNFSILGTIEGDRQKFQQCFLNVIKNAIESMPRGGQLYINTTYSISDIRIEIQDTGSGMSEDQLTRLGEPYYSTKGAKGTGLGMMVVFSIARAMKGTIKVKSSVGNGTTFTFTFPNFHQSSS
ncbi:ATP-binding protein [Cytobacillus purgationiresistens]|uniref:histidine kinase n=1 Tax=Cytobacillus purgationiresistens TaxID=863449 RepID=A0ABU0AJL1_9BACI|nr:ATP-binding protein [Cytobacillus purgationiresistens]MDQ0271465.1 two-component system sporulation sensor kinase B [Cytobacillus purgationiresistens]